jgi:solute carrier family 35 (UDP-sugar transporter), member A1/2/3
MTSLFHLEPSLIQFIIFRHTFKSLIANVIKGAKVLALYLVPAFLYCLYNNLAFHNLSSFDPTTYFLLLQLRVVITGILFQIIFKKYLSRKQWFSLILLTLGCMVKQIDFGDATPELQTNEAKVPKNNHGFDLSINAVFILIQTICSCLAGVYNESLLKDQGKDINIYIQNVFMVCTNLSFPSSTHKPSLFQYLDSILCNTLLLLLTGNVKSAFASENLSEMFRPGVVIIAINSCCIGIVTSFFLKYMNSILKTFASALELVFTAVLCWLLFSIPIYFNTILAITIVSLAVYLYSQSPVVNTAKAGKTKDFDDMRALLTEEDEEDLLQMDGVLVKST